MYSFEAFSVHGMSNLYLDPSSRGNYIMDGILGIENPGGILQVDPLMVNTIIGVDFNTKSRSFFNGGH